MDSEFLFMINEWAKRKNWEVIKIIFIVLDIYRTRQVDELDKNYIGILMAQFVNYWNRK